jgi:2-dehydro-3-deoxyphosphogluconate aldolase/(4S)-4-hydroxy-2-oxoglutarate aldolase
MHGHEIDLPRRARPAIPAEILEGGVVAIARHLAASRVEAIADALLEGGVLAFELTLNEPQADALRAIEAAARHAAGTRLAIGAGTVLSREAARRALDAGATFLVMPHTDPDLVTWAADQGIPTFPGAATPTEVLAGWQAGAAAVKVFPASTLGPTFVRELRGPFPDIPLLPSGGITLADVAAFIAAGAVAIGMGSWLTADGDATAITSKARHVTTAVQEARPTPRAG